MEDKIWRREFKPVERVWRGIEWEMEAEVTEAVEAEEKSRLKGREAVEAAVERAEVLLKRMEAVKREVLDAEQRMGMGAEKQAEAR